MSIIALILLLLLIVMAIGPSNLPSFIDIPSILLTVGVGLCAQVFSGAQIGRMLSSVFFSFASVYNDESTQRDIYQECVLPLLSNTIRGKNGSVFAYGPTGAGKTHTILGTETQPGIIPRCVKDLFALTAQVIEIFI